MPHFEYKKTPRLGDIITAYPNRKEYWGRIDSIEDSYSCSESGYIQQIYYKLESGGIAYKENQNIKWYVFSPEEHIEFLKDPENYEKNKQERKTKLIFEKVKKLNEESIALAEKYPKSEYYIYKLKWIDDGTFQPVPYAMDTVYEKIIIATTRDEAYDIAKENPNGGDTRHFWHNPKYLVCECIGSSWINESKVIMIHSQYDTC
jgi:hypothetical protein